MKSALRLLQSDYGLCGTVKKAVLFFIFVLISKKDGNLKLPFFLFAKLFSEKKRIIYLSVSSRFLASKKEISSFNANALMSSNSIF